MHVDAIGATVDLGGAQVNQIHQLPGQARLHDVAINAAERLYAGRSDGCVIQASGHWKFTFVVPGSLDAEFILAVAAWRNVQLLSADLDRLGGDGRLHDP